MQFPIPPVPTDWTVYGLDDAWPWQGYLIGLTFGSGKLHPQSEDKVHLRFGPMYGYEQPHVEVVSGPVGTPAVVRALQHGLARAGIDYGPERTDRVAGVDEQPREIFLPVGDDRQPVEMWSGGRVEVGFGQIGTTWIAVVAQDLPLEWLGLRPVTDLSPYEQARRDLFERRARGES
ncbi:MAG TPA: hypothetical protein VGZ32_07730 [Actinocrinis sp.]|jgi:hypothetical protein|uniref:hypothetical protein n=1 Tax=Actinocrinis sp. TaxID=1920516 RepID=UPI002DDD9308|nr:hypothetical protein [Actinocrinis sp.]HEV3170212.1 hypothetical protein [Actinocrinis sp.]